MSVSIRLNFHDFVMRCFCCVRDHNVTISRSEKRPRCPMEGHETYVENPEPILPLPLDEEIS